MTEPHHEKDQHPIADWPLIASFTALAASLVILLYVILMIGRPAFD